MSEKKEVSIVFEKDQFLKIAVDDPQALLDDIYSKDTGWVRIEDIILNRSHIKYAGIVKAVPKVKVRQKPSGM
ncbi:hypothetical protein ACN6KS_22705 [Paenibacillus nitricinens]|uniref:hypothetical protein n=1 Tax=Paenibacillus nitricinens TaxID=3367691 RepID=UPI003F83A94E